MLCICPSIYPERLEKMMDSFLVTRSKHARIVINYEIKPITTIFNEVFAKNPDEDFYMLLNDDLVFNTPLWDLELSNKGKISYGCDGIQNESLCTFPCIDGDIVRALGYLQLPTLNKFCGDNVWYFIGKALHILNYVPSVSIEHQWDSTLVDKRILTEDMAKFADWLRISHKDIAKVKEIL